MGGRWWCACSWVSRHHREAPLLLLSLCHGRTLCHRWDRSHLHLGMEKWRSRRSTRCSRLSHHRHALRRETLMLRGHRHTHASWWRLHEHLLGLPHGGSVDVLLKLLRGHRPSRTHHVGRMRARGNSSHVRVGPAGSCSSSSCGCRGHLRRHAGGGRILGHNHLLRSPSGCRSSSGLLRRSWLRGGVLLTLLLRLLLGLLLLLSVYMLAAVRSRRRSAVGRRLGPVRRLPSAVRLLPNVWALAMGRWRMWLAVLTTVRQMPRVCTVRGRVLSPRRGGRGDHVGVRLRRDRVRPTVLDLLAVLVLMLVLGVGRSLLHLGWMLVSLLQRCGGVLRRRPMLLLVVLLLAAVLWHVGLVTVLLRLVLLRRVRILLQGGVRWHLRLLRVLRLGVRVVPMVVRRGVHVGVQLLLGMTLVLWTFNASVAHGTRPLDMPASPTTPMAATTTTTTVKSCPRPAAGRARCAHGRRRGRHQRRLPLLGRRVRLPFLRVRSQRRLFFIVRGRDGRRRRRRSTACRRRAGGRRRHCRGLAYRQ